MNIIPIQQSEIIQPLDPELAAEMEAIKRDWQSSFERMVSAGERCYKVKRMIEVSPKGDPWNRDFKAFADHYNKLGEFPSYSHAMRVINISQSPNPQDTWLEYKEKQNGYERRRQEKRKASRSLVPENRPQRHVVQSPPKLPDPNRGVIMRPTEVALAESRRIEAEMKADELVFDIDAVKVVLLSFEDHERVKLLRWIFEEWPALKEVIND